MTKKRSKKNKKKKSYQGLRHTIEQKIGRIILEKINHTRDESSGPIMIPPIPDSKFIDKLPEGDLEGQNVQEKEHQDAYEAEVRLYRSLEDIEGNYIVIHQLEFTHEQYTALVGEHFCDKKRCKNGQKDHLCHKEPNEIEGECDMVVVGENFVIVFEVKGLKLQDAKLDTHRLKGCCESALMQRKRMKKLAQSIEPSMMIFQFTIFPNVSIGNVEDIYLKDETVLFEEDLVIIESTIHCCQELASLPIVTKISGEKLLCCLIGLWCIEKDGKWNLWKSSLTWCVLDIDQKLRDALVTRKSIDIDNLQNNSSKGGKAKAMKKNYPKNPGMFEAPKLFQDYLKINCLTQGQLDIFNCRERFLWVEGPAGAGKTVAMLGKIFEIVKDKTVFRRILLILPGCRTNPITLRHTMLLLTSKLTTCTIVWYDYSNVYGDMIFKVTSAHAYLSEQLSHCTTSQVIILVIKNIYISKDFHNIFTSFDHVFMDDYQVLADLVLYEFIMKQKWIKIMGNILSEGLIPLVKSNERDGPSLWVFCDEGQALFNNGSHTPLLDRPYKAFEVLINDFKSPFLTQVSLTINLRNTLELSSLLSIMRRNCTVMKSTGAIPLNVPLNISEQKLGHILRGTKPVFFIMKDDNIATIDSIVSQELLKLTGFNRKNLDIALPIIAYDYKKSLSTAFEFVLNLHNIRVIDGQACVSAEWPVAICLHRFLPYGDKIFLLDGSEDYEVSSHCMTQLYLALSRARVHCIVILYGYIAKICEDTDRFLSELKQRRDICKVIEL